MIRALIVLGGLGIGMGLFLLVGLLPCHDAAGCPDYGFFWFAALSIGAPCGIAIAHEIANAVEYHRSLAKGGKFRAF